MLFLSFTQISGYKIKKINNRLSVTSDYDCILVMLIGSSRNGRLEVTPFSVSTTSRTVSVIRRDALCNTSGLTAPGSLNTCPMCKCQRWIFTILLWHTQLSIRKKLGNLRVKSLLNAFCQFENRSANSMNDGISCFQLLYPDIL